VQNDSTGSKGRQWVLLLLVIPFIGTLWLPFYAHVQPELGGAIPFFYWYMFLWVIITAVLTGVVYLLTR
jgi:hypothetical protein